MLQAIEAVIHPDGTVHLLENLKVTQPTRVILTLLPGKLSELPLAIWAARKGDVANVLALLKSPRYQQRQAGNPAAMEATIRENRDAWGDE
jgi:hypothetical protein